MTDEYALRLAEKWAQGYVCSLRDGEAQEYHKACAVALHEREERSNGCVWCEYFATAHLPNEPENKFNYCPMCGRKLETAMPGEDKHHGS